MATYTIRQTERFRVWLNALTDMRAKAAILDRLERAAAGNFGDHEPVRDGIFEMRVHVGPGYRVYYIRRGKEVYVVLCGGAKRTQKADIRLAIRMAAEIG